MATRANVNKNINKIRRKWQSKWYLFFYAHTNTYISINKTGNSFNWGSGNVCWMYEWVQAQEDDFTSLSEKRRWKLYLSIYSHWPQFFATRFWRVYSFEFCQWDCSSIGTGNCCLFFSSDDIRLQWYKMKNNDKFNHIFVSENDLSLGWLMIFLRNSSIFDILNMMPGAVYIIKNNLLASFYVIVSIQIITYTTHVNIK